ncbi:putative clathrin assembly protein [Vitis vinifera]|uniref:Putative clathrin assembly protein n=1 Tax=Vitis vinifera TaxID=29760 RepID=A0A438BXA7_VITVI|nr:putative clathrin assembly protein [Vitis vinifera]
MGILIERFMELEVQDCVKVHEIFYRVLKQFDELDSFYTWCRSTGIARSSEYPEVEKIALKKLDLMDEFIRDKAALAQSRKNRIVGPEEPVVEAKEPEPVEENINAIKALPAPEGWEVPVEEEKEEPKEEEKKEKKEINVQEEGDLLNLGDDAVTTQEHGSQLALALFDGGAVANQRLQPGKPSQPTMQQIGKQPWSNPQAACHAGVAGPPTSNDGASTRSVDPFAASLAVAPPTYVQMSEMEKKQKLLMEEQFLWQQYARDGMPGHLGIPKFQGSPYNNGGYTHSY